MWQSRFGVGKKGIIHDFAVVFEVSRYWSSGTEGGCMVLVMRLLSWYDAKLMRCVEVVG
jgi:hypothetical protein